MLRLPFAEAGSASDTLFKRIRHLLDRYVLLRLGLQST